MTVRILSYGGGLDSFAMLVDSLQRGEPPDACVFADVGSGSREAPAADGEWPGTYRHVREVAAPLAEANQIPFFWLTSRDYPIRHGESLLAYFEAKRIIPSPLRRLCTSAAKVERIRDWLWDEVGPSEPVEVWIGFDAAEQSRLKRDPHANPEGMVGKGARLKRPLDRRNRYPLMERGLCRCRSELLVRDAGFPVPRKSACVFCPHASRGDFIRLARGLPDVFERVARMEDAVVARRLEEGKEPIYLGSEPLREAASKPYRPRTIACPVCGRTPRASKATDVDYLRPEEYVAEAESTPGGASLGCSYGFSPLGDDGGCDGCAFGDGDLWDQG